MKVDKVTLEILANHMRAAAESMAYTLYRTAHSTFVKETEDFTIQILDAAGRTAAVPMDLGATWYPGLDYGPAKQRALKALGLRGVPSAQLPDNDLVEDEVRVHLALFHADTQPAELAALRAAALAWMERLAEFRPHVVGAVWRGTATRHNDVHLQLYCDDAKSAEISRRIAGRITARHAHASTHEQLGERAHAGAGYSDEVNGARVGRIDERHHGRG